MPAVVRWRLRGPQVAAKPWRIAIDFRGTIPAAALFGRYYAERTRQNHASVQGRYLVYLVHGLDTAAVADGCYVLEVAVSDAQGNATHAVAAFTVANHSSTDASEVSSLWASYRPPSPCRRMFPR